MESLELKLSREPSQGVCVCVCTGNPSSVQFQGSPQDLQGGLFKVGSGSI